ncbi:MULTISPECIES: tape measure protein [Hyphomicrobiales]|uniref:tape measure protein n=1 Tax=Methylobacterium sp. CCH7-A2 TaxID=1768789 RepID=UPI00082C6063|nr:MULTISPECIES: tape measure protein [Hyphomicrobiales]
MANSESKKLTVDVIARIDKLEKGMARASQVASRSFGSIEDRAKRMENSVGSSFSSLSKRIGTVFAGIAVGSVLNDLRKTGDEYTKIINTLKVAGVSGGDMAGVFDKLFASAQRNAVPLDALASLYGRVSQAQTTLRATSSELLGLTDIVAQSLRVSGTSATEASGALLQLGQSLSGGKVQAEEYNSLLDGMYPLLQAAAAGLKEAGGDVSKLTALVKDGKVSSEAFFRAIQAGAPLLESKLAGATLTSAQAFEQLKNELVRAVGEFDRATGASAALAGGINTLAGSVAGVGTAATNAVLGVQSLIAKVGELARANAGVQRQQALTYQEERAARTAQAREMGLANSGGRETLAAEQAAANKAAAEANRKALADFRSGEIDFANRLTTGPLPPTRPGGLGTNGIKPRSLSEFAAPGGKDGGGAGGGGSKEKLDAYEKELIAIEKRTKALQLDAEMTGKSTFEKSKAKAVLDLETAAKRANVTITDEMRASIDKAATGYANAKVKVEEVEKALDSFNDASKFFGNAITDSLADIIIDGGKAEDVLKSLVKQLAKAALQAALIGGGPLGQIYGVRA